MVDAWVNRFGWEGIRETFVEINVANTVEAQISCSELEPSVIFRRESMESKEWHILFQVTINITIIMGGERQRKTIILAHSVKRAVWVGHEGSKKKGKVRAKRKDKGK